MMTPILYFAAMVAALIAFSVTVIRQGCVGVSVLFGKYHRILRPGLNFRIPLVETVYRKISLQNRSAELEFQAITFDQANVNFKTLILYAVQNDKEETVKKAAFKFVDEKSFMQTLVRSIESSIRAFVATKKQSEILALRHEIVREVNAHIEEELNDWGFHLINLQINDISFDEAIMRSMAQVVATNNMKAAAENEAQAQYISKVRVAQADAEARRLVAEAEKDAERLRGEGGALFRKQIADSLIECGRDMDTHGVHPSFMLYEMWLDSMKDIAAHSRGNILSFDGSTDGFQKTVRQMNLMTAANQLPLDLSETGLAASPAIDAPAHS